MSRKIPVLYKRIRWGFLLQNPLQIVTYILQKAFLRQALAYTNIHNVNGIKNQHQ